MSFKKKISKFFSNFSEDECLNHAASIAYFSVLSSLPIVFLISNIIGFLTGSDVRVIKKVYNIVSYYIPNLNYDTWVKLTGLFAKTSYSLNVLSIIILFFSGTMIFSAIDKGLKSIFKKFLKKERGSIKNLFIYASSIFFLAFLVFLYLLLDMALVFLKQLSLKENYLFLRPIIRFSKYYMTLVPFLLQILLVAFIFYLFVPVKLHIKKILIASLYTVFMWFLAVRAFSWYVNYIPTYNLIYGSMSIFIIFISWSFYSAVIFLSGAEILKVMIDKNES
ncbi:MAG: YihY/virulence factor BrkB family protein [Proteobacteria bacterium]|nr:YihY/virulence factor BrkB family protein [Pseudomonadota bacterium]